jgi:integrase
MIRGVCEKNGSFYRRFKIKDASGKWKDHYSKLPDPTDPGFAEALARVNAPAKQRAFVAPGSVKALAIEFRTALHGGWTKKQRKRGKAPLAANTMRNYLRYVDMIEEDHGHRLVADLRPAHIFTLRDRMGDTPGKANNWLNVLKLMLDFSVERDWRGDNPAARVGMLATGEHQPWPAEVLEKALAAATPMLRLAITTGLCSGQRVSDCISMQHGWHDWSIMSLAQIKTGVDVAVPMHPLWIAELKATPRSAVTLLYDRSGKPFTGPDRIQERLRRLMAEIEHPGYTFHGLRKNSCCYLLELGLSDTEVGAVLGMSPETVRHYGKRARALMIAQGAASKIVGGNFAALVGKGRS